MWYCFHLRSSKTICGGYSGEFSNPGDLKARFTMTIGDSETVSCNIKCPLITYARKRVVGQTLTLDSSRPGSVSSDVTLEAVHTKWYRPFERYPEPYKKRVATRLNGFRIAWLTEVAFSGRMKQARLKKSKILAIFSRLLSTKSSPP